MPKRIRNPFAYHSIWSHLAAPIWLRIPEKQRWTIVHWLDKSRTRCWSDLVSDALTVHEDDACDVRVPALRSTTAPRCASVCDWSHQDCSGEHECSCYCGKFQFIAPDSARDRAAKAV